MHQQKLKTSYITLSDHLYITLDIIEQKWPNLLSLLLVLHLPLLFLEQILGYQNNYDLFFLLVYFIVTTLEWITLLIITEKTVLDEKVNLELALKRAFYKLKYRSINLIIMWVIYILLSLSVLSLIFLVGSMALMILGTIILILFYFLSESFAVILTWIFALIGMLGLFLIGVSILSYFYFFSEAIALRNSKWFDALQYSLNIVRGNKFKVIIRVCFLFFLSMLANLQTPSNFMPNFPLFETIIIILFGLVANFVSYIIRIIITVSFLNLDYLKNGFPKRV